MPFQRIMPRALRPGDGVAIVSTSSPVSRERLNTIIRSLTDIGYRPIPMPGVLESSGYLAGSMEQRAAAVMEAFADPAVRLVLPADGGIGASQLVDLLDYDIIQAHPKIFTGMSDPSILCTAIFGMTGLITVHGVTGYSFFIDPPQHDALRHFWQMTSGSIKNSKISSSQWRIARRGAPVIEGPVIGGNLSNFRSLIGTKYMPDLSGAILMLEEIGLEWSEIDQSLTHLRLANVFDDIAGLIWGVPVECARGNAADRTLDDVLTRCIPGSFPIITNLLVGHADPRICMPIGGTVQIDMTKSDTTMVFREDVVAIDLSSLLACRPPLDAQNQGSGKVVSGGCGLQ